MRKFFNAVQAAGVVLAACALTIVVSPPRAGAATTGSVVFSDAPGTSAPPPALGPYTMTAFAPDSQPTGSDVNGVAAPDGTLGFSPALGHDLVGDGWSTWSNGYTGDVYSTTSGSITLTLPPATNAFYFYAEPEQFQVLTITATNSDGTTSGAVPVQGQAGAEYFGFYSTGSAPLTSITVTSADPDGFAVGEFGISQGGFTATGSLKVQPSTSQSVHQQGEVCKRAKFLQYKAEGYAIAAGFTAHIYTQAGSLLRHFLGGSAKPVDFPDGSKLSKQLLANPQFQTLNKSVQTAIAAQLKAGNTTIKLTKVLQRLGLYAPGDLHWSFGGTQGTDVTGSGSLIGGKYTGALTYTIRDSYGFSVNDVFYHRIGQHMRYLQTNCGNPPRNGGAHWFPDSVTATVRFSLPAG